MLSKMRDVATTKSVKAPLRHSILRPEEGKSDVLDFKNKTKTNH